MIIRRVNVHPCLGNIAWNSKEADQLPADPVLGILQFTFHSGVDVSEPSQPESVLWRHSLKFVSTILGFQRMYWAPVDCPSPYQQIIVLIQWDSGHGWKLFQSSLGFSMMLGHVESIFNRCIRLALPVNQFSFDCVLELVSFQFSTTEIDKTPVFKSKWEAAFAPHLGNATAESGLTYCCGEWLEADQLSEDRLFVGLLFWEPDMQVDSQRRLREANVHNLAGHMAELVKDATNMVSVCTSQLNQVSSETPRLPPADPPDTVQSQIKHPVFETVVKPEYNVNELTFSQGKDQLHLESMRQARQIPPLRIAGGPAGGWCSMGTLSQHHLPQRQGYTSNTNVDMITFCAELETPRVHSLFEGLRRQLWALGDCPQLVWAKDKVKEGDGEIFSLFIGTSTIHGWLGSNDDNEAVLEALEGSKHCKPEIRAQLQEHIQEFSDRCGDAIQNLSHKRIVGPGRMDALPNMDITTFDVPVNELDQRSFEYAFSNYLAYVHDFLLRVYFLGKVRRLICPCSFG